MEKETKKEISFVDFINQVLEDEHKKSNVVKYTFQVELKDKETGFLKTIIMSKDL